MGSQHAWGSNPGRTVNSRHSWQPTPTKNVQRKSLEHDSHETTSTMGKHCEEGESCTNSSDSSMGCCFEKAWAAAPERAPRSTAAHDDEMYGGTRDFEAAEEGRGVEAAVMGRATAAAATAASHK